MTCFSRSVKPGGGRGFPSRGAETVARLASREQTAGGGEEGAVRLLPGQPSSACCQGPPRGACLSSGARGRGQHGRGCQPLPGGPEGTQTQTLSMGRECSGRARDRMPATEACTYPGRTYQCLSSDNGVLTSVLCLSAHLALEDRLLSFETDMQVANRHLRTF